ncbi:ADP-ribose pyrophosphatase [Erysipelothrix rhusiopathiae]|uniref:ADP-ribose pyrophosphatase n=1 Tax=Erysipelothrix piscisicarius TaxID=2485784 RepID=A0A3S8RN95_9FIRM|nr:MULTISPECIES: OadG family transporter subunit [Erysipelothrix]AZK44408.1 ADP-ribose pyrophosphatase [Erysipelothrix piscisicarius]MBK2403272.1 ADP-ribose pyrophosphatase [Erysipelothrix sp. strain 2 (EsS2-7-Brazil)]NBA00761.1 ADP-ribose pyrophosphatase [Erysipelothrix rhusiopathiae]
MIPTFTFLDGLTVSLFSMLVVFVILLLLALVLQGFTAVLSKFDKPEAPIQHGVDENDEEHRLVAKLVVSCLAQGNEAQNIRIKSIKRVK